MKFHISLAVNDFDSSLAFYSGLFQQQPTIQRQGYAKWDVADPAVNFVIEQSENAEGIDHVGIQADSPEELDQLATRVQSSGRPILEMEQLNCCHAKMDKAWVKGMADEKWEVFLTHRHDLEDYGDTQREALDAL